MRKSLLLFALLLASLPGWATITYVNTASGASAGWNASTNSFVATTGNLLYVFVSAQGDGSNGCGTTPDFSVADTAGNTFSPIRTKVQLTAFSCARDFKSSSITGNATDVVTVTESALLNGLSVLVIQFSGVDTLDATASGFTTAGGSTPITSGSFTTATADEVLIAGGQSFYTTGTWTASGYTVTASTNTFGNGNSSGIAYKIVAGIQSGVTASMVDSAGDYGQILVATFKSAGGGGGTPAAPCTLSLLGVGSC